MASFRLHAFTSMVSFLFILRNAWGATEELARLDEILNSGYERRSTPTGHLNSTPTIVYCSLLVQSFSSPSPQTMDYETTVYFIQQWVDPRLQINGSLKPLDLNDPNLVKGIWKPEVYFRNALKADFHFVSVPNVLVRIYPNGTIMYMLRLALTFSCFMDLKNFPIDKQLCTMEVSGFSKTGDELVLEWNKESPVRTVEIRMTQFKMTQVFGTKCKVDEQIGNYSCILAEFYLERLLGFHIVESYIPTVLMVIVSWVVFWMDIKEVSGRVALGITTLLTVTSKASNIQESVESSYVKAIDIWMLTCTGFVFMSMMECLTVHYLSKLENTVESQRNTKTSLFASTPTSTLEAVCRETLGNDKSPRNDTLELEIEIKSKKGINWMLVASRIDQISRLAFPLSFSLFSAVYWGYYLNQ